MVKFCRAKAWCVLELSILVMALLATGACAVSSSADLIAEMYDSVKAANGKEINIETISSITYPGSQEDWVEFHNNGDGHNSFHLSATANIIQDFAVAMNAKSLDDIVNMDFSSATDPLVLRANELCSAASLNCSAVDQRFRTMSGVCNNLDNPHWGSAGIAQPRLERPAWENVVMIQMYGHNLKYRHMNQYGVGFGNGTDLTVHIQGNDTFKLFLGSRQTCTDITCTGRCDVDGTIVDASPDFWMGGMTWHCWSRTTVQGSSVVLPPDCPQPFPFNICYIQAGAEIVLNGTANSESMLLIGGTTVDTYTATEPMFLTFDGTPSRTLTPFKVVQDGDRIRVCAGCDCSAASAILEGALPPSNYEVYWRGQPMQAKFPVENVVKFTTSRHQYDTGHFIVSEKKNLRFGTSADLTLDTSIGVYLYSDYGSVAYVSFGPNGGGSVRMMMGQESSTNFTGLPEGDDHVFVDGRGDVHSGYLALYIAWTADKLYVGYGNRIGENVLVAVQFPNYSANIVGGNADSTTEVQWILDIEQINVPKVTSSCGKPRPSARDVSLLVHSDDGQPTIDSVRLTMHAMQFGQFLDHDIILTSGESVGGASPISCATDYEAIPENTQSRYCFNIAITNVTDVTESQGSFPSTTYHVLPFVRSAAMIQCNDGANIQFRENQNAITAFIDGSAIYGSTGLDAKTLRVGGTGAKLQMDDKNELPQDSSHDGQGTPSCNRNDHDYLCRKAGDVRSNEWPGLMAMHTLWVREHNRIVDKLISLGLPVTSVEENEEVYQLARRIVVAELQVVTYKEYLRSYMDYGVMAEKELDFGTCTYDATIDPSVCNEFGISNRFGHTWIRNWVIGTEHLDHHYFNPELLYENGTDGIMQNYAAEACPKTDTVVEDGVREHLHSNINGKPDGTDLAARNIQRGRDHGIPTYTTFRAHYGLQVPQTFDDLVTWEIMTPEVVDKLMAAYDSVDDIDIFTAVVSEKSLVERTNVESEADIGELLNYMQADFFRNVKCGDRYWFEFEGAAFNAVQINHLKEASSLSRILCDNTDITEIQPNAFTQISESNAVVGCSTFTPLDIDLLRTEHRQGQ